MLEQISVAQPRCVSDEVAEGQKERRGDLIEAAVEVGGPPVAYSPVEEELGPARDVAELYSMHDAAAAAAAAAGALVHALGESVPQAANIAEAALDPRGEPIGFSSE